MSGPRLKGVIYTWRIEFTDGHEETSLATSDEQARRIGHLKRHMRQLEHRCAEWMAEGYSEDATAEMAAEELRELEGAHPISQCHATTEDRPKARTR